MKKLVILLGFLAFDSCKTTIVDYRYPVENYIKNGLKEDIILMSYKNGKIKDSVTIVPNREFLILENRDGDRQSQMFQLDSIAIRFFNAKRKIDIYCPKLFENKDTIAGNKCVTDIVNIFHTARTARIYDEKEHFTKFIYIVDSTDYWEAR